MDFEGIFSVDPNTNIITSFYERSDDTNSGSDIIMQNILDTTNTFSPDYLIQH
jgi:hypothetical protein